jgi:quercetin dioxygenase-like cupin family protein
MARLGIVRAADVEPAPGWATGHHRVSGGVRAALRSPAGFPLWLLVAELDDGATVTWDDAHGDECVYVVAGALEVDGRVAPPAGAAIVEAGVATTARAVGPTRLVHAGSVDPTPPGDGIHGPPADGPRGVHVVGPGGTWANRAPGIDSHYYADSTCPTCRITLLSVGRSVPYESPVHSHTQDELIHVLDGGLALGARRVGPGDTLAIAAGTRYGFRGDPAGFTFLNVRRDASYQCWPGDVPPRLEGGAANGMAPVMDLVEPTRPRPPSPR